MSQMSLFYRLNAYKNEYVVYYIIIICYIKSYLICMHGCVTGKEGRECEKRACAFELFHFSFLYKTNAFFHKLMHKYYITLKKTKQKQFSVPHSGWWKVWYRLFLGSEGLQMSRKKDFPFPSICLYLSLPRLWSWSGVVFFYGSHSIATCINVCPGHMYGVRGQGDHGNPCC